MLFLPREPFSHRRGIRQAVVEDLHHYRTVASAKNQSDRAACRRSIWRREFSVRVRSSMPKETRSTWQRAMDSRVPWWIRPTPSLLSTCGPGKIRWKQQVSQDVWLPGCGRAGGRGPNFNCPDGEVGTDIDFGSSPILATLTGGRQLIVAGQKSGDAWAFDPDRNGAVVWKFRAALTNETPGNFGTVVWGQAIDQENMSRTAVRYSGPHTRRRPSCDQPPHGSARMCCRSGVPDLQTWTRLYCGTGGGTDSYLRSSVLWFGRWRHSRVLDSRRFCCLDLRYEPHVPNREQGAGERWFADRSGPGGGRRDALRDVRLRIA